MTSRRQARSAKRLEAGSSATPLPPHNAAEFAAQPAFAGGAIQDQRGVTSAEVFFVIFPDFRLIAFKYGTDDFELFFEHPEASVEEVPSIQQYRRMFHLPDFWHDKCCNGY